MRPTVAFDSRYTEAGEPDPRCQAQMQPACMTALGLMGQAHQHLQNLIAELEKRLDPVLCPECGPTPGNSTPSDPRAAHSPLANSLEEIARLFAQDAQHVAAIIQRLEI